VPQDPKLTVGWALACMENAIRRLPDGSAERRVRVQFHQLLLALERDRMSSGVEALNALFLSDERSH